MKWTQEPGLMAPLSWHEWIIMATVFGLLILDGWAVIRSVRVRWKKRLM